MKRNIKNKTYCSVSEFKKDFFPHMYQNELNRKQVRKIGTFEGELVTDFMRNVSNAVKNNS